MGKSSSSPAPVDPYAAAGAQYGLNTQTAQYNAALNRTGSSNDIGSSGWNITGKDPKSGAPLYGFSERLAPQFAAQAEQPINLSGLQNPTVGGQQDVRNALYGEQQQYLQPKQERQTEQMKAQLANEGAIPGSLAYDNAMSQLNRDQTFQNNAAANSAITGATGQQGQLEQIGLGNIQAQESAGKYGPELYSLMNGGGGGNGAYAGNTDILGAFQNQYQGQLNAANASNAANNQATGDTAALASSAIMAFAMY